MESQKNSDLLSRKTRLIKQLNKKEITLEEFLTECAYWAVEHLDELTVEEYPIIPSKLAQFKSLSSREQEKVGTNEFWRHPEIFNYTEEHSRRKNKNKFNLFWLKEYLRHIPEGDVIIRDKINLKIMCFEDQDREEVFTNMEVL